MCNKKLPDKSIAQLFPACALSAPFLSARFRPCLTGCLTENSVLYFRTERKRAWDKSRCRLLGYSLV